MARSTPLLRVAIAGLALTALTDPHPWRSAPGPRTVRVRDLSASLGPGVGRESAPTGGDEWLGVAESWRWVPRDAAVPPLAREGSALGAALHEAARRHPGWDVELITDGRATDDALAGARAVRAAGGRLYLRAPAAPAADVGLLEARASRAAGGGGVAVDVRLEASVSGRVRVVLERGARRVAEEERAVRPGRGPALRLTDPAPGPGAPSYSVRVEALAGTPDDDPGNDALAVGVRSEAGSVLVWADAPASLPTAPDGPTVSSTPRLEPGAVDAADVVVLAGLPWSRIGDDAVAVLTRFAAGGGRLLVLGGEQAYGPGGWGGTSLERSLLPLRVRTPPGAGLDWVVALDVSGSTAGEPLRALVAAALAAFDALQPGERLAVLPFSGRAAPRPLEPGFVAARDAAGRAALAAALAGLAGGGETDLVAGVRAAADLLAAGAPAGERRLLLLTDGDPDHAPSTAAWKEVGAALAAARVRLGALVYGDAVLLDVLRRSGAADPDGTRPLKDAAGLVAGTLGSMTRQRAALERERLGAPRELDALPGSWAALLPPGWRPASVQDVELEPPSRLVARARWTDGPLREAPFAAERRVGSGLVAALAWGPALERDAERGWAVLRPLVQRLLADADRGLAAELDDAGRLEVRRPDAEGAGRLLLAGAAPPVELLEVAPGLFRSVEPVTDVEGLAVRGAEGSSLAERALRLPARPPPEHRGCGPDPLRLAALAQAGGGRVLAPAEPLPRGPAGPGVPLAPWLLAVACILLVLERRSA